MNEVLSQTIKISNIENKPLIIGYDKTFHLIMPSNVKYLSVGNDNIIAEVIDVFPSVIRLKAIERDFRGTTNVTVVTEDTKYYTYTFSYSDSSVSNYREGDNIQECKVLPVSITQQTHIIYPNRIIYVDYGNTTVEVTKAENIDNILAVKAIQKFDVPTNITTITEDGGIYILNLKYEEEIKTNSFIIEADGKQRKSLAILDNKERNALQKEKIEKEVMARPALMFLTEENSKMQFIIENVFIDNDIMLFKMCLSNSSQIGYTLDFIKFYIQDEKIKKKTAVQQVEQQQLFTFSLPSDIPANRKTSFIVALPKFTIPDKKILIIEIQEKNGGRNFFYKVKNSTLLKAEILFRDKEKE